MFLICHVTSFKHMFKGLCEFMGGRFIHHIDMLSEDWSSESGYIKFLMSRNLTKAYKGGIK